MMGLTPETAKDMLLSADSKNCYVLKESVMRFMVAHRDNFPPNYFKGLGEFILEIMESCLYRKHAAAKLKDSRQLTCL